TSSAAAAAAASSAPSRRPRRPPWRFGAGPTYQKESHETSPPRAIGPPRRNGAGRPRRLRARDAGRLVDRVLGVQGPGQEEPGPPPLERSHAGLPQAPRPLAHGAAARGAEEVARRGEPAARHQADPR